MTTPHPVIIIRTAAKIQRTRNTPERRPFGHTYGVVSLQSAELATKEGLAYLRLYLPNPTFLIFLSSGSALLTAFVRSLAFDW